MFCRNCRAAVDINDNYCKKCGYPISTRQNGGRYISPAGGDNRNVKEMDNYALTIYLRNCIAVVTLRGQLCEKRKALEDEARLRVITDCVLVINETFEERYLSEKTMRVCSRVNQCSFVYFYYKEKIYYKVYAGERMRTNYPQETLKKKVYNRFPDYNYVFSIYTNREHRSWGLYNFSSPFREVEASLNEFKDNMNGCGVIGAFKTTCQLRGDVIAILGANMKNRQH